MSVWPLILLFGNVSAVASEEETTTSPTRINIIPREEWGARQPSRSSLELHAPVSYAVVHHGGSKQYCTTQEECSSIVRSYQRYHMWYRGWNDIGYNFIVGEDGNVYEGRGWDKAGAHAPTFNYRSIGICIIGDFTDRVPNDAALNALKELIQSGIQSDRILSDHQVIGHRQNPASSTACPGDALYREITSWSGPRF